MPQRVITRVGPAAAAVAVSLAAGAGCGATRDVVPDSQNVVVARDRQPDESADGYLYVARRPFGALGLADFRGLTNDAARAATDVLAEKFNACAGELARSGGLVDGAARLVARIGDNGAVDGVKLTAAPGAPVTANALLCLASPMKLLAFVPSTTPGQDRGIAIEASWQRAP